MATSLQNVIDGQRGIFARHQAIAAGCTPKEFTWLTRRDGVWIRIRYGVYANRTEWEALPLAKQEALLDRAALLGCDDGTVLSHSSAARLHELPLYDVRERLTHVTRLRTNDRRLTRSVARIKHHCSALAADDITSVDGLPVTSVARTVLDIASEFGYRTGLVTADAALTRLVTREQLTLAMQRFVHDSHARTRAAVVADADGRAESPLETLARIFLKELGIVDLEPQYEIRLADGATVFVDLYSSQFHHCFECDGKLKYREQVNLRGVPVKADDVVWDEKQREDKIRGAGFGMSRLVWKDTTPRAFAGAKERVWREIRLQDAARLRSRTEQPA
jgi:predicted transcriptional regulator of viral defense system